MNPKEITITIPYERRMKELALMLSQCQMLEELLKSETINLQEKAKVIIEEDLREKELEKVEEYMKIKNGEKNGGQ